MEFLYVIVALVLIFDFINGFHDSANSIATVVSTRVLTPFQAVSLAAFFNFAAIFVFSLHVATTMGKGVVNPDVIDLKVIGGALSAAIIWNLVTWWFGLPSSSSHTLVGGLIGATIIKAGTGALIMSGILKIVAFIFISPTLGMVLSFIISLIIMNLAKNMPAPKADKFFRKFQIFSASLLSLGHGGNDAQKSM
ncbi:MAG: anion permease, partial [Chloroflexota bacterium]